MARNSTRTTRSYLAGIGASGALLACAFVGFLSLIGAVSVSVWPEPSGTAPPEVVELQSPPSAPAELDEAEGLVASADIVPSVPAARPDGGGDSPDAGNGPQAPGEEPPAPPDEGPAPDDEDESADPEQPSGGARDNGEDPDEHKQGEGENDGDGREHDDAECDDDPVGHGGGDDEDKLGVDEEAGQGGRGWDDELPPAGEEADHVDLVEVSSDRGDDSDDD